MRNVSLLNVAMGNFLDAQNLNVSIGERLERVFLGLSQVAGAVEAQVSDPAAQLSARVAKHNFQDGTNIGNSISDDDIATLALGLQQLAAALKVMN